MMKTGLIACRLSIAAYIVPFLFFVSPEILGFGTPIAIVVTTLFLLAGILALAAGFEAWLLRKTSWLERIFLLGGGAVIMWPLLTTRLIGVALLSAVILTQIIKKGKLQPADALVENK